MLSALLTLSGLGLIAAAGLAVASRVFYVDVDPRIGTITEILPGANCGACGFPGCGGLAKAIVEGDAQVEYCTVVDKQAAIAVADVMGVIYTESEKDYAIIHCDFPAGGVGERFKYLGITDCRAANLISGGPKLCSFACIGLGTCKDVCPFDAITMNDEGLPIVDMERCTACGNCVEACPKNIIDLAPKSRVVHVQCSSKDKGGAVKKICTVGCISCMACEKVCPYEAIKVIDNIAQIDYDKCRSCGICVTKCPTGSIVNRRDHDLVAEISDKCNGCTMCARACPVNAITGEPKEMHKVDSDSCIGCGICVDQCKRGAVILKKVERQAAVAKVRAVG
jgi:H+/Na+-translocating ferredoxin:NAD+ oxidoreductase subunit B